MNGYIFSVARRRLYIHQRKSSNVLENASTVRFSVFCFFFGGVYCVLCQVVCRVCWAKVASFSFSQT